MKDKAFLDTNILIYSQRSDDLAKRSISQKLIQNGGFTVSTQSFNELCNVLIKKYKIDADKIFEVIYVISELAQEVFIINENTIFNALKVHKKYKYSYYDSLIIASALECECSYLFSEDMNDRQIIDDRFTIINPFEHFDEIEN
jgi:predicted nucleic acid-binding protein